MRYWHRLLGMALSAAFISPAALAQYQINWYSTNSGGGTSSGGGYVLSGSIGQSVAGYAENAQMKHWIGFWVGDSGSATVVSKISDLKTLDDGTLVSFAGKIATSADSEYSGFFYVEESDRSSGIRVAAASGAVPALMRGSVVNVIGKLGTTAAGERQIVGPSVIIAGSTTPIAPLFMTNKAVGGGAFGSPPAGQYGVTGGAGTNNVGLLIRTSGRVTGTDGGFLLIDDGSGTPVRVDSSMLAAPPAVNDHVTVIGVSSLHKPASDRLRLVLPRDDADVAAP